MGLFDAFFPAESTTFLSGAIERIGPLMVADDYGGRINGYALRLHGNKQTFHVIPRGFGGDPFPNKCDIAIALAQPGDQVAFEHNPAGRVRVESFCNKTVSK